MLAANIGAGSTVGATALGYANGICRLVVGRIGRHRIDRAGVLDRPGDAPPGRRAPAAYVGDYLEYRYRPERPRVVAAGFSGSDRCSSSPASSGPSDRSSTPSPACLRGSAARSAALVITVYFAAGGLLTSAWVNVVQLAVKMVGFAVALPLACRGGAGGTERSPDAASRPATTGRSGGPARRDSLTLAIARPAVHRVTGTAPEDLRRARRSRRSSRRRPERARPVRRSRSCRPSSASSPARISRRSPSRISALPMLLVHRVPPLVGAIGLAAVFSAEISAADAILFMLTTSLSQDLYKRFVNPAGGRPAGARRRPMDDRRRAARSARCSPSRSAASSNALTIFYTLLGVSLFVPIVAGLYVRAHVFVRRARLDRRWRLRHACRPRPDGGTRLGRRDTGDRRPGCGGRRVGDNLDVVEINERSQAFDRLCRAKPALHETGLIHVDDVQDCGDRGRRDRQGSHSGGNRGPRSGDEGQRRLAVVHASCPGAASST